MDPVSAVAIAGAAFSAIKKGFAFGRDMESMSKDLGRWMGAMSDIKKCEEQANKPPLFKKLFFAGSVEEEALQLLMHEKKIIEQEKELQALLNFRYGYGTWDELKEMRRKIRDRREKEVYKQAQMRADLMEAIQIGFAILVILGAVGGLIWFALSTKGII